jgi:CDP-diacylglycerol pyrophosphatase
MIVHFLALLAFASHLLGPIDATIAKNPGALRRVVEACVLNHELTGAAFPCAEVNEGSEPIGGFVVLRAPLEQTHILVVPTTRIVGIEDLRLMAPDAPNFFEDAWKARHYVLEDAPHELTRDDIGLAINSKSGRTQDQLHIHVGCVRMNVRHALELSGAKMPFNVWAPIRLNADGAQYRLLKLKSDYLQDINVFKLAAQGLAIHPTEFHKMTIAVTGASFPSGDLGFYILASLSLDASGVEALLDDRCRG